jgi:hypothetical protein
MRMADTNSIIRQIEGRGHAVFVHQMRTYIELHATPLSAEGELKLARCDGVDDEAVHRCAVELARMVGIDLKD